MNYEKFYKGTLQIRIVNKIHSYTYEMNDLDFGLILMFAPFELNMFSGNCIIIRIRKLRH